MTTGQELDHRTLVQMNKYGRIRATYLHACLCQVNRDAMTNTTLRELSGIEPQNSAMTSRLVKEAVLAGRIRLQDQDAALKLKKYVHFWA